MPRPNLGPRLARNAAGRYEIRWSEDGRSYTHSLRTVLLGEAQQRFSVWLAERHRAAQPDVYTVLDAYRLRWQEHVEPHVIDQARLQFCWDRLLPVFGKLPVSTITPATVKGYERMRAAAGAGGATVRKELSELSSALNHLVKTRRVSSDAVSLIPLPPKGEARDRFLSAEEIERLLETAAARRQGDRLSRVERYVWILLQTGCRPTPPLELTWDRVDLDRGTIAFDVPGRRRTKKRRPTVRISQALLPVLRRAHAERTGNLVLDHTGSIRKAFDALVAAAGLEDVTRYTLRHTWATHAAMNGVDLWRIAGVLGNTIQVVEANYAHHSPDYQAEAVDWSPVRIVPKRAEYA